MSARHRRIRPLTPVQKSTVRRVALGKTRKDIAFEDGVSAKAVESRFYQMDTGINDKTGTSNPVTLTHWAIVNGLVTAGEPLPRDVRRLRQ